MSLPHRFLVHLHVYYIACNIACVMPNISLIQPPPKTRASSALRMRSRNTTRLMPPFTRTDGHNIPATPEFLAARPNAWHIVSKPLSVIFVKFWRIQLDNLSHAGRSATVSSSTDESSHSIPHVIRGFKSSSAS